MTKRLWGTLVAAVALVMALQLIPAHVSMAYATEDAQLVPVKMGITSLSKEDQVKLWKRLDEYATVDALLDFCGKKLFLQKRTWNAVAPCVEVSSLRKVAAVFRAKKSDYIKSWETAFSDPEKKKVMCEGQKSKLAEYTKILDAHINEASTMCSACLFC